MNTGHRSCSFAIFDNLPVSYPKVYQKSPRDYTAGVKEARHDQTIACPRCYMRMLVRYMERGGSGVAFDKFITCLNP